MSLNDALYLYSLLSKTKIRLLLCFTPPYSKHPQNRPHSKGILNLGNLALPPISVREMSWIPYLHSSMMEMSFAKRVWPESIASKPQRAMKPASWMAKTMALKILLYDLSNGQLMKTLSLYEEACLGIYASLIRELARSRVPIHVTSNGRPDALFS